jgi:Ca2+-transporting ATPase
MESRVDIGGLSDTEAAQRLATRGPNTLEAREQRNWRRIGADAAREPMFLLLVFAALLYMLLGQLGEGLFLCLMVAFSLGLALYNEGKTERALAALRDLSSPLAKVLRSGRWQTIPGAGLVRGDIVALNEGDRVPADARLISSSGLQADESQLTGESMPVDKEAGTDRDAATMLFSGSLIMQGHGIARVTATGARSQLGKISASLHAVRPAPSPLQRQTKALARAFAVGGLLLSSLVVLLYGVLRGDWLQAVLAGIALAMSMLPEELPVVMTVFPAIGAWRLARQQVLTRRLAAIETLGAISVLCVDKTGTLTANRMDVVGLQADGMRHALPAASGLPARFVPLVETAMLASAAGSPDPVDQAVGRLASTSLAPSRRHPAWRLVHEYGISARQHAVVQVWRRDDGSSMAAAKGAPETVIAWCNMDESARDAALAQAAAMARSGLRVLAVAHAELNGEMCPGAPAAMPFVLAGLLALADPLRPDIPACVAQCRQAGIRVVMITGDHPDTARAIAKQAGLDDGPVLTGVQLDGLDRATLATRLGGVSVCARITPDQKLRLIQAFLHTGATVAMTGDGVNDAPALRAAHVGIAMGKRGTDVAREAAALVLLDDRFASIVEAIRSGRRIHDNMRKSMRYVISMHAPIAGLAMLPIMAGWPTMLYPMHIVFMELMIDPACSLVFENEAAAPDLMHRPPRDPQAPLFTGAALVRALALGGGPFLVVAACYAWALGALAPEQARAFGFVTLVLANLSLILANRAAARTLWSALARPNPVFLMVAAVALVALALVLYVPWLAGIFQFGHLPPMLAASAGAAGLASGLLPAVLFKRMFAS